MTATSSPDTFTLGCESEDEVESESEDEDDDLDSHDNESFDLLSTAYTSGIYYRNFSKDIH